MKILFPLALLALVACSSGGGSSGHSGPAPTPVVTLSEPDAPSDLYFNQHDTIDVTVHNAGPGPAAAQIFIQDNGDTASTPIVPTLDAGTTFTWSFQIWAAQDVTTDHVFTLTCPSQSWMRVVTIHYHSMSGG